MTDAQPASRAPRALLHSPAAFLMVLAFVMVESSAWMGESGAAFAAIPEIQEAHIIAGSASVLVKVRTATTEQLQDVLRGTTEP